MSEVAGLPAAIQSRPLTEAPADRSSTLAMYLAASALTGELQAH